MGRRHIEALQAIGANVVAIADLREDALAEAAPLVPAARRYSDWKSLLAEERIDVLTVATTSASHAGVTSEAADAGVPRILCEKPLATTVAEGRRAVQVCRQRGVRLAVNHARRVLPVYVSLRRDIEAGRFGDLRSMRVVCGGGGIANIGTHAFDLMRWFCGPAVWVVGVIEAITAPNPRGSHVHDPGGHGMIGFAGGVRATFDLGSDFPVGFVAEFSCRHGRIVVDEQRRAAVVIARTEDSRHRPVTDYRAAIESTTRPFDEPVDVVRLTCGMLENLLSSEPLRCDGDDGVGALELAVAAHVSSRDGQRRTLLPLDEEDDPCLATIA